ncbi:MAG TPA: T9SS type A sorting domain-containing protein [Chitinophagaceae bacterium]|nr:T9SS type A sorting domain-containing protein [Chitinophagaceae bacterium]
MNSNLFKTSFAGFICLIQINQEAGLSPVEHTKSGESRALTSIQAGSAFSVHGAGQARKGFHTFQSTLPLTLLSFTAEKTGSGKIELVWKTAQEVYTSHFNIERSLDGRKWVKIGTRYAKGQQGTVEAYSYTDANPSGEANYYRLQVVDDDNSSGYSSVRLVTLGLNSTVRVYPSLARANNLVYVEGISPEKAQVELYSTEGRPVFATRLYSNTFNTPNLFPGIYHVRITDISRGSLAGLQKIVIY